MAAALSDSAKRARLAELRDRLGPFALPLSPEFANGSEDTVLARYLAARGYDVAKAAEMLQASLAWRRELGVPSILNSNLPAEARAVLATQHRAFFIGFSRASCPVYLEYLGATPWLKVLQAVGQEDIVRSHVQCMEVIHRLLFRAASARAGRPVQRQVNILDLRGFAVSSMTGKALELTKAIAGVNSNHYPETLDACYIINPPMLMSAVFSLVARMMDEKTRAKIQVIPGTGAELAAKLRELLGPDAHVPTAAVSGPPGDGAGLLNSHELVFAYVAERERLMAQGGDPDAPPAVHSSASYSRLAALGGGGAPPKATMPTLQSPPPPPHAHHHSAFMHALPATPPNAPPWRASIDGGPSDDDSSIYLDAAEEADERAALTSPASFRDPHGSSGPSSGRDHFVDAQSAWGAPLDRTFSARLVESAEPFRAAVAAETAVPPPFHAPRVKRTSTAAPAAHVTRGATLLAADEAEFEAMVEEEEVAQTQPCCCGFLSRRRR